MKLQHLCRFAKKLAIDSIFPLMVVLILALVVSMAVAIAQYPMVVLPFFMVAGLCVLVCQVGFCLFGLGTYLCRAWMETKEHQ